MKSKCRTNRIALCSVETDLGCERMGARAGIQPMLCSLGEQNDYTRIVAPERDVRLRAEKPKYASQIANTNGQIERWYASRLCAGRFPCLISGDHSSSAPVVDVFRKSFPENSAVIWLDSHPDLNTTKTSPSQLAHGMALAAGLGYEPRFGASETPIPKPSVFLLGIRSVDYGERIMMENICATVMGTSEVVAMLENGTCEDWVRRELAGFGAVHLSIDVDILDAALYGGFNSPVNGGLVCDELCGIVGLIVKRCNVKSCDIVEFNPFGDKEGKTVECIGKLVNCLASLWKN